MKHGASKSKMMQRNDTKISQAYKRKISTESRMGTHRTVLPVLCLIQLGMGRFCFRALPSLRLMINVLLEPCKMAR